MIKFFSKDPYQTVIDFINAVVDSDELANWLAKLESEPDNMRLLHLAEIRSKMIANNERKDVIDIVELLNNPEILHATNNVIRDVRSTGINLKKNNTCIAPGYLDTSLC